MSLIIKSALQYFNSDLVFTFDAEFPNKTCEEFPIGFVMPRVTKNIEDSLRVARCAQAHLMGV